jgi:hypothetical protein
VGLVLDQTKPRQIIEILDAAPDHLLVEGLAQLEVLADGNRNFGLFQLQEEVDQHGNNFRNRIKSLKKNHLLHETCDLGVGSQHFTSK